MKGRDWVLLAVVVLAAGLLVWGIRREGVKPDRCHVQRPDGSWSACTPAEEERCESLRQDYGIRTCVWPLNPPAPR